MKKCRTRCCRERSVNEPHCRQSSARQRTAPAGRVAHVSRQRGTCRAAATRLLLEDCEGELAAASVLVASAPTSTLQGALQQLALPHGSIARARRCGCLTATARSLIASCGYVTQLPLGGAPVAQRGAVPASDLADALRRVDVTESLDAASWDRVVVCFAWAGRKAVHCAALLPARRGCGRSNWPCERRRGEGGGGTTAQATRDCATRR